MLQNGRLNLDVTWHRRTCPHAHTHTHTQTQTHTDTQTTVYPTGAVQAAAVKKNSRIKCRPLYLVRELMNNAPLLPALSSRRRLTILNFIDRSRDKRRS